MEDKDKALVEKFIINAIMDHAIVQNAEGNPCLIDNVEDVDLSADLRNYNISRLDKSIIVAKTEEKFPFVNIDERNIKFIKTGQQIIDLCTGKYTHISAQENSQAEAAEAVVDSEEQEVQNEGTLVRNCTADNCECEGECSCRQSCDCGEVADGSKEAEASKVVEPGVEGTPVQVCHCAEKPEVEKPTKKVTKKESKKDK